MRPKDNPFSTSRLADLRLNAPDGFVEQLVDDLQSLAWRGAIVAPKGYGKTTLMRSLRAHFNSRQIATGWILLREETPRLSAGDWRTLACACWQRCILFVDGAEQLPHWQWLLLRELSKRAGGLIISSHRPGMLPTLHQCQTTPNLLAELVAELQPPRLLVNPPNLTELHTRHHGNIREVFRDLYEVYANV